MPKAEDIELGRKAVSMGLIKSEELATCLQSQETRRQKGEDVSLVQILLENEYITKFQKDVLIKSIQKTNDAPIQTQVRYIGKNQIIPVVSEETKMMARMPTTAKARTSASLEKPHSSSVNKIKVNSENVNVEKMQKAGTNFSAETTKVENFSQNVDTKERFFGRYKILEEIGRGGMGQVYRAYDPQLDRTVALKVMLSTTSEESRERFLREAKTMAKLQHPNIAAVYDLGEKDQQVFFIMEYIDGVTLDHADRNRLNLAKILDIIAKVAEGIHHAHLQGVIHRDIKPNNIMLDNEYQPKVMDFGLAKLLTSSSPHSHEGMLLGTILYMSPEQADGKLDEIDARSDIYSLGIILYELLTGYQPHSGKTFSEVIHNIANVDPLPVSKRNIKLPRSLDRICRKMLAKDKKDRYSTALEVAKELQKLLETKQDFSQISVNQKSFIDTIMPIWTKYKKPISIAFCSLIAFIFVLIINATFFQQKEKQITISFDTTTQQNVLNTPVTTIPNTSIEKPNTPETNVSQENNNSSTNSNVVIPPKVSPQDEQLAKEVYENLLQNLKDKNEVIRWELLEDFLSKYGNSTIAEKVRGQQLNLVTELKIKFNEQIRNISILYEQKRWDDLSNYNLEDSKLIIVLPQIVSKYPDIQDPFNQHKNLIQKVRTEKARVDQEVQKLCDTLLLEASKQDFLTSWQTFQKFPQEYQYTKLGKALSQMIKKREEEIVKQLEIIEKEIQQIVQTKNYQEWPKLKSNKFFQPESQKIVQQIPSAKEVLENIQKIFLQVESEYVKQQNTVAQNTTPASSQSTISNTSKISAPIIEKSDSAQVSGMKSFPDNWKKSIWQSCWNEKEGYLDFTVKAWTGLTDSMKKTYINDYQKWYASQLGIKTERVQRIGGTSLTILLIPPGRFSMGSPSSEPKRGSDETSHNVVISKPFWIGKYEVKQSQWLIAASHNPSQFRNSDAPVENISWLECAEFLKNVGMRFPTEAEWEYSCRAGTNTAFSFGRTILANRANFDSMQPYENIKVKSWGRTLPTGTFRSYGNFWGCYDMHGNVAEWCQDGYAAYPGNDVKDPVGPTTDEKVVRGGAYNSPATDCRSAARKKLLNEERQSYIGLRVAMDYTP